MTRKRLRIAVVPAMWLLATGVALAVVQPSPAPRAVPTPPEREGEMRQMLDAPLLFVKRHSYTGIHIYDTFYKWPPGGGGIYVLENPSAPREQWRIRPVIDETTPGTLGHGVYTHPELSWDAKKLLFCFKGEPNGSTSIYEINIDGTGLRRASDPAPTCDRYKGSQGGQHDIAPAYLPDGRIVFLTTRPSGLVPCANKGVSILHVMNADGSDMHPISVNNVNEFDPSILPDGRVLFGRWEYVDKNALTIQSLWTVNPDGTQETALFANNMVLPEAVLDARAVPGSHLIVGTLAKHNSTPRGTIAFIDPHRGKNGPQAIINLEYPDDPTYDRGDSCEPWALNDDVVVFSGRPSGQKRNVIEMMDRAGHRFTLLSEPDICLHSPMLVKPRPVPMALPDSIDRKATTGRFFLQDIYRGLTGVKRGEVKWLRVIEETSRVSPTPGGKQPYNQTFLVSAALAFSVKNYLGVVPVDENGSAYFEVPAGRAVYLQALDADGRLVHSMRTFVQAAPGTTRSCIGCHENKSDAAVNSGLRPALGRAPSQLRPESWGSGYVDYPSMVQPLLDKHCVACHGGKEDIAAGLDLSGGWTEHFNISYENLANRRETQLVAYWIAGIDCMNGTAHWSSPLFPPRGHGSGAAPLAKLLLDGHNGRIASLTRTERDLLMAWIDSNGLYHGTWDYTTHGCAIQSWDETRQALTAQMQKAGCARCHNLIENDWINLKDPPLSRVLRAPLAKVAQASSLRTASQPGGSRHDADGFGLELCRDRKVDPQKPRVRLLWKGYAHAIQPLETFAPQPVAPRDTSGALQVSFASTSDPNYQAFLAIIRDARDKALAAPRADMPGAEVTAGECRQFIPPPLPQVAPPITATVDGDGVVELTWERSARTIGLEAEVHRSEHANFTPNENTLLTRTTLFRFADKLAAVGRQHYALVMLSGAQHSKPTYATVTVPPPVPPSTPTELRATPASYAVRVQWQAPQTPVAGYNVYRAKAGSKEMQKLTPEPVRHRTFADSPLEPQVAHRYVIRTVSIRGLESEPTAAVEAAAIVVREPVFVAAFDKAARGALPGGETLGGKMVGPVQLVRGVLDAQKAGHVTFPHHSVFDLTQPFALECWVWFNEAGEMPVIASCGAWKQAGWFLQRIGRGWRWHVGGVDCDGGQLATGRWIHLAATCDGKIARLFQDGVQVAEKTGPFVTTAWPGALHVAQYSGSPGPPYQVNGRIAGLKIYHRPLAVEEIAVAAKTKPE